MREYTSINFCRLYMSGVANGSTHSELQGIFCAQSNTNILGVTLILPQAAAAGPKATAATAATAAKRAATTAPIAYKL